MSWCPTIVVVADAGTDSKKAASFEREDVTTAQRSLSLNDLMRKHDLAGKSSDRNPPRLIGVF